MIIRTECTPPIPSPLLFANLSKIKARLLAGQEVKLSPPAAPECIYTIRPRRVREHETPIDVSPTIATDYTAMLVVNEDGTGQVRFNRAPAEPAIVNLPAHTSTITLGQPTQQEGINLVETIILYEETK